MSDESGVGDSPWHNLAVSWSTAIVLAMSYTIRVLVIVKERSTLLAKAGVLIAGPIGVFTSFFPAGSVECSVMPHACVLYC